MHRPDAPLQLPHHGGDHHVAAEPHPRPLQDERGLDHRRDPAFHVAEAVTVEPVTLDHRLPRIPPPPDGQGIGVGMPVEHQRPPAPRSRHPGDALEAARLDLLQLDRQSAPAEKAPQVLRHRRFLGCEAREPGEIPGQLEHLAPVVGVQHLLLCRGHGPGPPRRPRERDPGTRGIVDGATAGVPARGTASRGGKTGGPAWISLGQARLARWRVGDMGAHSRTGPPESRSGTANSPCSAY